MEFLKGLLVVLFLLSSLVTVASVFIAIWVPTMELTWLWVKIGITSAMVVLLCVLFIKLID